MANSFAVEFKNVTKEFGDVQAVRNLNFSIEKGQLVTLLGFNCWTRDGIRGQHLHW